MKQRPRVYVTRKLPAQVFEILAPVCEWEVWEHDRPVDREVLLDRLRDCQGALVLITDRIDEEVLDCAPQLKVVANMAVGYDNIDVAAATRRGVMVTNTPGVLTETTADLAFALILATARQLPQAERALRAGRWEHWRPFDFAGQDVYGATLGIVGLGRIGAAVARRAKGFGMRVIYHNRRPNLELEAALGVEYCSLDDLLQQADIVSLHCPLTESTRHLIGERELRLMKPTAILINTSRGAVVDEEALLRALQEGRLWAAGLDVFQQEPLPPDHPLLAHERVVALPHMGSASVVTRTRMARLAAENLAAALSGKRPPHLVNPEVWEARRQQRMS